MTSSTPDQPLTARRFLFDPGTGAGRVQGVGDAIRERGVARSVLSGFRRLSSPVLAEVDRGIGEVAEGMLDIDLGDALVCGWRKHAALAEAARRTLAAPGSEEVVLLAAHRIDSTYRPQVDLFVDHRLVNSFEFVLQLVFDVTGIAAVVRAGELTALRGGDCLGTATLTLEGAPLARRQHGVDLRLVVRLRPPAPLAEKQTGPPPSPPTGPAPGSAAA
jgi:hypothetical protein